LDAKDREMECNGTASSKRKKPQQLHKVSGLQPQGVSLAFSPSFIEAKWLLFDCLWIRVLGMVGALGALATSREEERRHLFEKFGQVTSFLTKRDWKANQLLDHARGKAGWLDKARFKKRFL
jgi:hypothetical protein